MIPQKLIDTIRQLAVDNVDMTPSTLGQMVEIGTLILLNKDAVIDALEAANIKQPVPRRDPMQRYWLYVNDRNGDSHLLMTSDDLALLTKEDLRRNGGMFIMDAFTNTRVPY